MSRVSDRTDFYVAVANGEVACLDGSWTLRGAIAHFPIEGNSLVAQFARDGLQDGTYELRRPWLVLGREAASRGLDGVREFWREHYPGEDHGRPAEPAQEALDV